MITLSEHTIEETIINKTGYVLDLGCVNFSFSKDLLNYCDNVICVDPNTNIKNIPQGLIYENAALVHDDKKEITFYIYNDIQGYSILNPNNDCCRLVNSITVKALNIKDIMDKYNIKQFELIKFDIEGAEYEILNTMDWTISKQYSIEFHDFRNMNPYSPDNEKFYEELRNKTNNYIDIITHEKTRHPGFHGDTGLNYWDSLFILKKEYWL